MSQNDVMLSLDPTTREALTQLCLQYAVRRLKLFGSAAGDGFDAEHSDLDFLVEFDEPPQGMRLATQFFGFMEELQSLFGRRVDLLEESAIENSRLLRTAQTEAVTLFAA